MSESPIKKRVHLRITQATYERLQSGGDGSVQDEIRQAINAYLSRRDRSGYREVVLSPRGSVDVDQMLSWLGSRAPMLNELQAHTGGLHRLIKQPMRDCLSPTQMRRVTYWIEGKKLSVIGRLEGVSKQAVHASIQRSLKTLSLQDAFLVGLCQLFPDSGLTPEYLRQALQENNHA